MKEEVIHSDASLEAMLGQFQISQPEGLNCQNSQKIGRMCINPKCDQPSLICNDLGCSKCQGEDGEIHLSCSSVPLRGVTVQLKKRTEKQRDFIASTYEI